MTDNDKVVPNTPKKSSKDTSLKNKSANSNVKAPPVTPKNGTNWSLRILLILLLFIGGMTSGIYFLPTLKARLPIVAGWIGEDTTGDFDGLNQKIIELQARLNALSQKSDTQENQLNQLSTTDGDETTTDLLARLEVIEQSLSITPEAPVEDRSDSARLDMLLSRMSQLETSFIPLSKNLIDAQIAIQERSTLKNETLNNETKISNIESRLLDVEKFAAKDNSSLLSNLRVAELSRKVISGTPYFAELNKIEERTNDTRYSAALNYLSLQATNGILTPTQLQNNFNTLIPELLIAAPDTDASWWQSTIKSFKNIVTVRRTDGSSYSDLDPSITEIESWLKTYDIRSALRSMNALPPSSQTILAPWIKEANVWLESEEALSTLETIIAEDYLAPEEPTETNTAETTL